MIYKKNARIVIIDDEIEICEMIKNVLLHEKFEPKYYIDSEKFVQDLRLYNHDNLDLIIIDLMMPKIDGFQLLEILNSNKDTRFIPKMVVSAFQSDENIKDVYKYGAIQFIEKPLSIEKLLFQVQTLLRVKLYEDYNRNIIELLKEKNKKLMEHISNKCCNIPEINIKNIDNTLESISVLIQLNNNLLKKFTNLIVQNPEFKKTKEYEILLELLLSMKSLDDKRKDIEKISQYLTRIINMINQEE